MQSLSSSFRAHGARNAISLFARITVGVRQVWLYDSTEIGRNGCCVEKRRFVELFPMLDGQSSPLTGNVDSVHYSYHSRAVFMLAGESVYELVPATGDAAVAGAGAGRWWLGVVEAGPWYNIWYDICDVE